MSTRRPTRLAIAAAVLLVSACATQSLGERLGVDVRGIGTTQVELRMDAQHAWSPVLAQRGAELVAEYRTPGSGLVREVLAASQAAADRSVSFNLPRGLKGNADGAVCLYLQLPANRSILPVRRAQGTGVDTARFRFPAWESGTTAQGELRALQAEVTRVERQVGAADNAQKIRSAALAQRGWPSAAACDAIPANAQTVAATPPIGVLPIEQQEAAARHACINRMVNSARYRDLLVDVALAATTKEELARKFNQASSVAGMGEQAALVILQMKGGADPQVNAALAARQREATVFRDDWRRYRERLGRDYYPAIGKPDDLLELIGAAHAAHRKLLLLTHADRLGLPADRRPELNNNEALGLAGGMIDSYNGCVADGRSELRTKLAAWVELQRDSPERTRRIREHFVSECRSQHEQLARLVSDRGRLDAEMAQAQQRLATAQAAAQTAGSAGSGAQLLNGLSCQ